MKQNQIQQIRIHVCPSDQGLVTARMNQWHVKMIERALKDSGLSPAQQLEVIDKLEFILKNIP